MLRVLVCGEAGRVGGYLEEHPAGLAEVDGAEVVAVEDGGHVVTERRHPLAQLELSLLVGDAEGDVVDGPYAHRAAREAGAVGDVHGVAGPALAGLEAGPALGLPGLPKAQSAGHELGGAGRVAREEGYVVEASYGVLGRDGAAGPSLAGVVRGGHQLQPQAVGVGEAEDGLAEAVFGPLEAHAPF